LFARKNKHLQFHRWTKKEAGKNNLNKVISLNLLSECYRNLGDYDKAILYNKKSFSHYGKVIKSETYNLVPLLMTRGYIYWDQGKIKEAEYDFIKASGIQSEFINKNFKTLSEYEKENFYSSMKENFDVLNAFAVDKLSRSGDASDSLFRVIYDFQIKTKAIILNESNRMLEVIHASKDQELMSQFNEWRKFKNELAKKVIMDGLNDNDPSIREIKYSINRLEKEMSAKTSLFSETTNNPSWKDIRSNLKPEEAAVEVIRVRTYGNVPLKNTYYRKFKKLPASTKGLTDSVVYLFLLITPESKSPEALIMNDGNKLEATQYKYYRNAQLYKIDDQQSYNIFWKPLQGKLPSSSIVYFSSDGIYNLVNLSIMKNPVSGKYLIDEVRIINLTNTKEILSSEDTANHQKTSILLLGRPNYSKNEERIQNEKPKDKSESNYFSGEVNDLPGTEREVKIIDEYLKRNNIDSKVLLWNEATEELLKEADSRHIMHIATHGFFDANQNGQNPMLRSGLLLAGITGNTSREDGILTAYEASTLDLSNTNLVVLSACETGLGEIKNGEGVYGLQRAFEVAGVDAILMSMWKVNDQTTQELMVAFYEELLQEKPVMEAFKNAQLRIRSKYPEPLYWGAFKLIGR
jgi:CHAT domain-containing protein